MKDTYLLVRIVDKLRPLFRKSEVDFDGVLSILTLKLTLDDRKGNGTGNSGKMNGFKANLLMLVFVGLFMGLMFTTPFDLYYKIALIASMDLFFMVMYMVSDFSNVLLDVRDKHIIMTKPVSSSTLNMAKMIHIIYYMIAMFVALNLVSMVIGTGIYGVQILAAFFVMMITLPLLVVFATTLLYSALLEKFNGERLKDIINVFQIAISIITVLVYQVMARVFEFVDFELVIQIKWWTYLLPPAWYSGLFKILVEGDVTGPHVVMAITAIVAPIGLGIFLKQTILPKFEHYLNKLQMESGVYVQRKSILKKKLYKAVSVNQTERAFMWFTDSNLSRDRKLKLTIYPNQALAILFPFIMLFSVFQSSGGLSEGLQSLNGSRYFMFIYLSIMFFTTNFEFIQFSEKFEASFIYDSFPIENKRLILTGAAKTYYMKYELPAMVFLSLMMLYLTGIENIFGIILMNLVGLLLLALKLNISKMGYPFSMEMIPGANKKLSDNFLFMGIVGVFAGLHYFLIKDNNLFSIIAIGVILLAIKILFVKARVANKK